MTALGVEEKDLRVVLSVRRPKSTKSRCKREFIVRALYPFHHKTIALHLSIKMFGHDSNGNAHRQKMEELLRELYEVMWNLIEDEDPESSQALDLFCRLLSDKDACMVAGPVILDLRSEIDIGIGNVQKRTVLERMFSTRKCLKVGKEKFQ